jgi:hypothetical protein
MLNFAFFYIYLCFNVLNKQKENKNMERYLFLNFLFKLHLRNIHAATQIIQTNSTNKITQTAHNVINNLGLGGVKKHQ